MFRNFLHSSSCAKYFNTEWIKKLGGLIRVAVFDPDPNSFHAYVTTYHEQSNHYRATSFDIRSGEIHWTKNVTNGGYGAPIVTDELFIFPTKFSNIVALSKKDGREIWQIETSSRVRSPLNVKENKIYFSSGGTIFELDAEGKVTNQWVYDGAFFYGSVDVYNELVITLGTISDENEESIIKVFAFHKKTGLVYSLPISKSGVISGDTTGISWRQGLGFVGGDNLIICFRVNDGKIVWTTNVHGFAGRHVCTVDDHHVYYSTLSGVVGALDVNDGTPIWIINTKDTSIVSPISVQNNHLFLLADAHLNVLRSHSGQITRKVPVGHSPYSMVSFKGDFALLGSGEPPHNGLLFAFKFSDSVIEERDECFVSLSNAFIESKFVDVLIHTSKLVENLHTAKLDCSVFNQSELVKGERVNTNTFAFRVTLPPTIGSGDFVVPVHFYLSTGEFFTKTVCIHLSRNSPLPPRAYLNHIPDIVQDKPNYSGAAIGSALKNLHGDKIEQADLREMIDFSLNRSGYESFQTWRILLRRALTSGANKKEQLPEYNQLNAMHDE